MRLCAAAAALLLFTGAARAQVGPHADEAARHAGEPDAYWTYAEWPVAFQEEATHPQLAVRVYGYLPYWESIDSSFRWDLISDLVVFAAGLTSTGTVSSWHGWPNTSLIAAAHSHGVRIHLAATLFSGTDISTLVNNATYRAAAAQTLAHAVGSNGGDGLNLDFEFVNSTDRDAFSSFLEQVKAELAKDAPGAELSIASPPSVGYRGYDFARIARSAKLLVMGYDYHWSTAPTTGAVAPLTGSGETVSGDINGLLALAPAGQIALGVPYYGYDWPASGTAPGATTLGRGTATLYKNAIVTGTSDGLLWDTSSETPWYRYVVSPTQHQVWFDDAQSLTLKYRFLRSKNLAGAMIWALGYDSGRTELWQAIQNELGAVVVTDAGSPDAGGHDAGSTDAGSHDGGSYDAGSYDAGSSDAGSVDAGSADAGNTDGGSWGPDGGVHVPPPDVDAGDNDGGSLPETFTAQGCSTSPAMPGAVPVALVLSLLGLVAARRRR